MQIRYGNMFLEAAGAGMAVAKRTLENAANIPYAQEVTASVEGYWTGTQDQLIAKCSILENALAVPFQDLVLIANDGTIALRLANAGSLTGTRCLAGPEYPQYRGAEFVTYRMFRFSVTATYPLGLGPVLLDFLETLETSGGGPVIDFQLPANAPPIPVRLYQSTPYRATQQGFAVQRGLTPVSYPIVPGPIFPSAVLQAPVVRRSAIRTKSVEWNCRVEWSYSMGSAVQALLGLPNAWR